MTEQSVISLHSIQLTCASIENSRSVHRDIQKIGEARRLTAINAGRFRFERCMTGTQPLVGSIAFKWCDADQHDASLNHAEIFGDATRDIDDAAPMLGVHAVIDLDDGTTVVIYPPDSQHGTQGKAVAGGRKEIDVEDIASRRFAPLKAAAIKTGMPVEPGSTPILQVGLPEGLGRRATMRAMRGFNPL